jgi:hypothetical protein
MTTDIIFEGIAVAKTDDPQLLVLDTPKPDQEFYMIFASPEYSKRYYAAYSVRFESVYAIKPQIKYVQGFPQILCYTVLDHVCDKSTLDQVDESKFGHKLTKTFIQDMFSYLDGIEI